jgi:hypothetical protein
MFGERARRGRSLSRLAANKIWARKCSVRVAPNGSRDGCAPRSFCKDLDSLWIWFYKEDAPMALKNEYRYG